MKSTLRNTHGMIHSQNRKYFSLYVHKTLNQLLRKKNNEHATEKHQLQFIYAPYR